MLEKIISLLKQEGWILVDFTHKNALVRVIDGSNEESFSLDLVSRSFDLIAKKDEMNVIIKYIENIDNFTKEKSSEMKNFARVFNSTPLIIGARNRRGMLEDQVLYTRYSINAINFNTFMNVVAKKEYPRIYSMRGGQFVQIKPEDVKELRLSHNMSLNDMQKQLDLKSKKAIYEYETGNMKTRLSHFENMAKVFNYKKNQFLKEFTETIDIFTNLYKKNYEIIKDLIGFQKEIDSRLVELGFLTYWFDKSPIDMSFRDQAQADDSSGSKGPNNVFISEISSVKERGKTELKKFVETTEKKLNNHVVFLKKFQQTIDARCNMVILLDDRIFEENKHLKGIPIIHEGEIPSDAEQLKKIIFKRKK